MKKIKYTIFFLFIVSLSFGQKHYIYMPDTLRDANFLKCIVIDGDTVPHRYIHEIIIFPPRVFKNKRQYRRYTRLVRYVKKVYPYSQIIKNMLIEIE